MDSIFAKKTPSILFKLNHPNKFKIKDSLSNPQIRQKFSFIDTIKNYCYHEIAAQINSFINFKN